MYGVHTNEEIEWFVDTYISYDVSLIAKCITISTHVHVKKKNHVVCRFHYPLLPMLETKNLEPLQINGN
jgi:hypothetical protein